MDDSEWSDMENQLEQLKDQYVSGKLTDIEYFLRVDEVGTERFIGIIRWPSSVDTPRGTEFESSNGNIVNKQNLGVYTTNSKKPCAFCNADQHVEERGGINYGTRKLLATQGPRKGAVVAWSCEGCLVDCYIHER